ncbi:MAG: hypothetical protein GF347_01120 [Candidatus Moranbacteria bacterium]|nr:hypothetical protein [Candidatus Moranbacteria bacterium]
MQHLSNKKIFLYAFIILDIFILLFIGFVFVRDKRIEARNRQAAIEAAQKTQNIDIEWNVEKTVYPLTYFGQDKKLIEIKINSPIYTTLNIESQIDGLSKVKKEDINIKPGSRIVHIAPDISEQGYKKLENKMNSKVRLKISKEGETLVNDSKSVQFMAINEIVWQKKGRENHEYILRLVNKDAPKIVELVGKAAKHVEEMGGEDNIMIGTLGDRNQQISEMKAVFAAMSQDYDIKYVFSHRSYFDNFAQRLKTPSQVLETNTGLCIELSLVMSAALEHVSLRPVIIIVPGHAFAGIELGPKTGEYVFIETTLLSEEPQEALKIGQEQWEIAKMSGQYKILNVTDIRQDGIIPIQLD